MKWLCTVGVAVSLALQPALADETEFVITIDSRRRGMPLSPTC